MTPHWSEQCETLKAWLLTNPRVLIGCDFDGTLSPLVDFAGDACLPAVTRAVLQRLISLKGVTVAFISGRPLDDLLLRVNLAGAFYAGNHGLEMAGLDGKAIVAPGAVDSVPMLRAVKAELTRQMAQLAGVWIEDKELTLSVHYRLADPACHAEIEKRVREGVAEAGSSLIARSGKLVWEIRPANAWDKGTALRLFMQHLQLPSSATAFIGDDTTDRDAFRELPDGWTCYVGDGAGTGSRANLRDVEDCAELLEWMAEARGGNPALP